ncbi:MAG: MFS transporter [Pseudomonadota bacterium]
MTRRTNLSGRGVAACASGNVLEWYDFTVYGFIAPILAQKFFPTDDPVASLLAAFAVLAVGYAARPVGSIVFGHVGDRIGRKPAMIWSVAIMGVGSVSIGLLPDYDSIGIAAPVLLILIRIMQGFAVAGEYTASGVLVVEEASSPSRFLIGSIVPFAMMWGCVLGAGVPAAVSTILPTEVMQDWGWRLPFFVGGMVAMTSVVLRRNLSESSAISAAPASRGSPVFAALSGYWRQILAMIGLMFPAAVIYYVIFVYAASDLTRRMHVSSTAALDISTSNLAIIAVLVLLFGYLADRFGFRLVLFVAGVTTLFGAYPLWGLMHHSNLSLVFLGQLGFSVLNAVSWSLSLTTLSGLVPPQVRCSAVAIGYNTSMAIFGGTTPFFATYLVSRTGDDFAPAYYVIAATVVSLAVIASLPKSLPHWRADEG